MNSWENYPNGLYIKTPLLHSKPLSDLLSKSITEHNGMKDSFTSKPVKVSLKLENVQLSNSFKIRGISRLCVKKLKEGFGGFTTFSGGNAAISLAYTCHYFQKPCHIVVPSFVSQRMVDKIKSYGAEVEMASTGQDALNKSLEFCKKNPMFAFIHPYDDPLLWKGYSTMVDEIKDDLSLDEKPSCFIASCGGGGMLTGILKGLENLGWQDIPVFALETIGAHSLNKSLQAGKLVENSPMTSVAKTLGAPFVAQELFDMIPDFRFTSVTLSDEQAIDACLRFADDHTFLVEVACGVSLALIYSEILPQLLKENNVDIDSGPVVLIVCGGNDTSAEILTNYGNSVGLIE